MISTLVGIYHYTNGLLQVLDPQPLQPNSGIYVYSYCENLRLLLL